MTTDYTSAEELYTALKYRVVVDQHGTRRYYNNLGHLHCTDGPAVIWVDGTKYWFQNDQLHCTDGAAVEYADGDKHWYQNGLRHRTDGPAIVCSNGTKHWYLHGVEYSEVGFRAALKSLGIQK